MPRLPILFLLAMTLGGCSRTDDGTVVIPKALDARRVDLGPLDLRHPGRLRPEPARPTVMAVSPEPFPIAPGVTRRQTTTVTTANTAKRPTRRTAAPAPSQPSLACDSATRSGERVRVVCE